ncbi:hypothetical protein KEM54_003172 [Ascosphaera aggregata]|nr:hypothetical protein KEM54_003172 [Ascosphaera aggregata]
MSTRDFAMDILNVPTPEPLRIRKVQSTISRRLTNSDHGAGSQLVQDSDAEQDGFRDMEGVRTQTDSQITSPMSVTSTSCESKGTRMSTLPTVSGNENLQVAHDGQHIPDFLSKGSKILSRIITSIEGVKQRSLTTNASPSRILAEVPPPRSQSNLRCGRGTKNSHYFKTQRSDPSAERSERAVIERKRGSCSSCRSDIKLSIQKIHPDGPSNSISFKTTYADVCLNIKRLRKLNNDSCLADIVVEVEARVSCLNQGSRIQRPSAAALDVTVFIDNLIATEAVKTRDVLDAALTICTTLVPHYDRLSLYTIQSEWPYHLQCLLPSESVYKTSMITNCLDTIKFPAEDVSRNVDFARILAEVSRSASVGTRRNALAELFVITDKEGIELPSECLLARLRVHTITLRPTCEVTTGSCVRGLHLAIDYCHSRNDMRRRLYHMIDFIRADLDSGVLQSISAEITAAGGCLIDNSSHLLLEHQRLDSGERWAIPLSVKTGAYPELLSEGNMRCLRAVYEEGEPEVVRHDSRSLRSIPLFRLNLQYKHSQLPNFASVTTSLTCRLDIRPGIRPVVPGCLEVQSHHAVKSFTSHGPDGVELNDHISPPCTQYSG